MINSHTVIAVAAGVDGTAPDHLGKQLLPAVPGREGSAIEDSRQKLKDLELEN